MIGNPRQAVGDFVGGFGAQTRIDQAWSIVSTTARRERILARRLEVHRIVHFLPLTRVRREYAGQFFDVEVPVFPGRVFACAPVQTLLQAASGGDAFDADPIVRKIEVVQNQSVFCKQLENLARALQCNVPLEQFSSTGPPAGVHVEVCDGQLKGLQGWVERLDRPEHLVLQVDALGEARSTLLCDHGLRVIDALAAAGGAERH